MISVITYFYPPTLATGTNVLKWNLWYNKCIRFFMTQTTSSTSSKAPVTTVVIVGGGFGGVRCARELADIAPKGLRIVLISDRPHLEYYGAIYKLLGGHAPREVSVPLDVLLRGTGVELVMDSITGMDMETRTLTGASGTTYAYDNAVLAVGAQTNYFGIEGMKEHSMTFKSIQDALALKHHLHATLENLEKLPAEQRAAAAHFVVIGAGATGVEVSSELKVQGAKILEEKRQDPSVIQVDLIEALPRVMALLPEDMSPHILKRLQKLGVNVQLETSVQKAEKNIVHLKDRSIPAHTIVWTAGVKAHDLYASVKGLETDKKGRVVVDEQLRAKGRNEVFVIGDGAATQYAGMAQTAIYDATYVSRAIVSSRKGTSMKPYVPKKPALALPVGDYWAAVYFMGLRFYGLIGWFLRQAADIRALLLLMSPWTLLKLLGEKTRSH